MAGVTYRMLVMRSTGVLNVVHRWRDDASMHADT